VRAQQWLSTCAQTRAFLLQKSDKNHKKKTKESSTFSPKIVQISLKMNFCQKFSVNCDSDTINEIKKKIET
jgi:anti-sigma28 factor (negative regulator of flagellin synthesis)